VGLARKWSRSHRHDVPRRGPLRPGSPAGWGSPSTSPLAVGGRWGVMQLLQGKVPRKGPVKPTRRGLLHPMHVKRPKGARCAPRPGGFSMRLASQAPMASPGRGRNGAPARRDHTGLRDRGKSCSNVGGRAMGAHSAAETAAECAGIPGGLRFTHILPRFRRLCPQNTRADLVPASSPRCRASGSDGTLDREVPAPVRVHAGCCRASGSHGTQNRRGGAPCRYPARFWSRISWTLPAPGPGDGRRNGVGI
jgi:hypothetical protein